MLQGAREATRRADDGQFATTRKETAMQKLILALAAAALAVLGSAADADEYPNKPVTLVAVFGPGSASDTICRVIAQPLSLALKESVIVENRPGANGALAAFYVARSAPDGYTLLMGTNSPLSAAPFLMRNLSYDPVKDFEPVSRVGSFTLMLVVNSSLPVKSVKELIDYAKAHPSKLSFASANTSGIVAGETLAHWAGLDMLHVPYKSSPPAIEDVIAGRVSMMIVDFTVAMPHVSSGQVRALAVTRLKRSPLFPDLPTLDEAGLEGFELDAWAGLVAPAKTPPAIVAKLNGAIAKIIDDPATKQRFRNVG